MRRTAALWLEQSSAANWGAQHTPVMIAYGSKASKGTPMIARVSAGAVVRWGWVLCGAIAASEVGVDVERARGKAPWQPPTSSRSSDLGQSNNHPRTRYRPPVAVHGVAQTCPFIRIANIDTRAPHAAAIIARRSDRPRPRLHSNNPRTCRAPPSTVGLCRPPETFLQYTSTIPNKRLAPGLDSSAPRPLHDALQQHHYMRALLQRQRLMYRVI